MLVDEGSNPFEMGVAAEVFGLRRPELSIPWYDFAVCAPGGAVRMHEGMFRLAAADLSVAARADTVIVPNRPDPHRGSSEAVLTTVRAAWERGARLVSFCTGAFTLAAAGVLNGRRATTHWRWAELFRTRFPTVDLQPDVLFVDDGEVLTAAGSAAALDLALHIVTRDHGAEIAASVARRLVFAGHRDGGQRQFVERPIPNADSVALGPLLEWARGALDTDLSVTTLARHHGVSRATLHRRFRAELGATPLEWLTAERVRLACRLLEKNGHSIDRVAGLTGLGSAANLRFHFRRSTGLTPSAYRARFGQRAA